MENSQLIQYILNSINISDIVEGKVDKVVGKDLSTNDFGNAEKIKLESLQNFSKDYNELNNKPTIPSITDLATKTELTNGLDTKANISHLQPISSVINLQVALDSKYSKLETMNTEEIQILFNTVSKNMNWKEPIGTYSNLQALTEMIEGDAHVVTENSTIYIYSNNAWVSLGSSASVPIATETVDGLLSKEDKIKLNAIVVANIITDTKLADELAKYTDTITLDSNYAKKTDLASKANVSDIYTQTQTDNLLNNKVDKVSNKSLIDDSEITRLQAITGVNTGDETIATIKNKLGTASSTIDGYLTSVDWNTFNNKQNKIFIQSTQPTIATDNIWIDNTNPTSYALKVCNSTSYVQVGNSASGSVQEIIIQNTQPSDITIKLWLDTSSNPVLKWYNGTSWINIGSSSGHSIQDSSTTFTQRKNLKFTGSVTITDDSSTDSTIIGINNNISSPVEPKESIALADGQDIYDVISHTVGTKYMFILVDGVRIPYADYTDLDSTHIQLKPNIATDIKKDMVITSFSIIIETVLNNSSTLNGGEF